MAVAWMTGRSRRPGIAGQRRRQDSLLWRVYLSSVPPPAGCLRVPGPGHGRGGVAERSKAHAWNACKGQKPFVGSNPTPSATNSSLQMPTADGEGIWVAEETALRKGQALPESARSSGARFASYKSSLFGTNGSFDVTPRLHAGCGVPNANRGPKAPARFWKLYSPFDSDRVQTCSKYWNCISPVGDTSIFSVLR